MSRRKATARQEAEPSDVVDEVWSRNAAADLTPDEVMEMVYAELKAMRAERDAHKPTS